MRDRLLFLAIWDIGGGGAGGTVAAPVELGRVRSTPSAPQEVAYDTVPGAGAHNFSVGEQNGILYAA